MATVGEVRWAGTSGVPLTPAAFGSLYRAVGLHRPSQGAWSCGDPCPAHAAVLLEASTLLSSTGNGITIVALPWLVLERTGSPTAAGVVAAATALPLLAGSLLAGTLRTPSASVVSPGRPTPRPRARRRRSRWWSSTVGLARLVLVALAVLGALQDPAGLTARETLLPAAADAARWRLIRVNGLRKGGVRTSVSWCVRGSAGC